MAKEGQKNDEAGTPIIPVDPQTIEVAKSKKRMEALTRNVFESIGKTADEVEGDFTIYEIMDVLLRVSHSYNKRFLDDQHKKIEKNEG